MGPNVAVPLTLRPPLQPPLAVHDVALPDDQESWVEPPAVTVLAAACNVSVGAGTGAWTLTVTLSLAEPPAPLHDSV
jgi:hypothetical protein